MVKFCALHEVSLQNHRPYPERSEVKGRDPALPHNNILVFSNFISGYKRDPRQLFAPFGRGSCGIPTKLSGHSKWSQIKHKKAATDAKKSKIFGKMAAAIAVAAREKGGNPNDNPTLRMMIDKARSFNMPMDSIERAVKKGIGEIEGMQFEEVTYEAYGPGGVAIIIKAITDNKNRTLAEIKHILSEHEGKFAESGSVRYLFDERGVILARPKSQNNAELYAEQRRHNKEELEMAAIEAGAEDIKWKETDNAPLDSEHLTGQEKYLEIYTKPEQLMEIKKVLEEKNIVIESASLDLIPKNEIKITDESAKEKIQKLFEALDEQNEVEEIYSNFI